jgi:hypothetical protein
MDRLMPEVVAFGVISAACGDRFPNIGTVGKSQYNLSIALSTAAATLVYASREYDLRKDFNMRDYHTYFDTPLEAQEWKATAVRAKMLSPYKVMKALLDDAIAFLIEKMPKPLRVPSDEKEFLVSGSSIDASQGDTFNIVGLALPFPEAWTEFSADARRMITGVSRAFRTLLCPNMISQQYTARPSAKRLCTESICAMKSLKDMADDTISWEQARRALGITVASGLLWQEWQDRSVEKLKRAVFVQPDIAQSIAAHISSQRRSIWQTDVEFRKCGLCFLRSLRFFLKLRCNDKWMVQERIQEVQVLRMDGANFKGLLAQRPSDTTWFFGTFLDAVLVELDKWKDSSGYLENILPNRVKRGTTRIYSVAVSVRGDKCGAVWIMARMEWLCLQILVRLRHMLEGDPGGAALVASSLGHTDPATPLKLHVAWGTHKMEFDGFQMKSNAAGANERADFFLLGQHPAHLRPVILATLYHTTNVPQHTASSKAPRSPETRLLGRALEILLPRLDDAVYNAATCLREDRGLDAHSPAFLLPLIPADTLGRENASSSSGSDEED